MSTTTFTNLVRRVLGVRTSLTVGVSALAEAEPRLETALSVSQRRDTSPLWFGVWLAVVLIGAKAVLLGVPQSGYWPVLLSMASFQDVLFALTVGAAGEFAVRLAARRAPLARCVRGACLGFCTLCATYSVVSVGVFNYFDRPLSYDLIGLVGNIRAVRSSITERITPLMMVAFLFVPAVFLAGAMRIGRRRFASMTGLGAACVWATAGFSLHTLRPDDVEESHLVISPHVELARSTLAAWIGARRPTFPEFPPEYTEEFRSFKGRRTGASESNRFDLPSGADRPRNVIVIVLESVGTKYMSLYGSAYDTTPNLVAESTHALVFDNFYTHVPYTLFAFRTLNFGIYSGLPWRYAPWAGRDFPPPLAGVLRDRGWRTGYFNNGDLDWTMQRWFLDHCESFDTICDYRDLGCEPLSSWGSEDRCTFERLIRWIDEDRERPFAAVCWTDQTHDPYPVGRGVPLIDFYKDAPPPAHAADLARYLNILHETDRQIGRLFEHLRERGIADDTLVVITGDHGEAFADPHDHRGHCVNLFEEDVNVPMILWNPRLFAPGRRIADVGAHVDINPTIADVLGVEPPGAWQGHSLFDPARPERAYFFGNIDGYRFGVREGDWKYIIETTAGREMLFDLAADPKEQRNLANSEPQRCARLRQRIAAWVSFEEEFLRGRAD